MFRPFVGGIQQRKVQVASHITDVQKRAKIQMLMWFKRLHKFL